MHAIKIANNMVGNFTYLQSFDLRKNIRDVVIRKFHLHGFFHCQSLQVVTFKAGTLLERNGVCNRIIYMSFLLFLVLGKKFLLLKTCRIGV